MRFIVTRFFLCVLAILLLTTRLGAASPASAPNSSDATQELIDALADPDPKVRDAAAEKLTALGAAARPALVAAAKEGDPRISPRAANILLKLPWVGAEEPPLVRQLLVGYGDLSDEDRRRIIARLWQVPGSGPALVRLLQEEPSESVAWTIFNLLCRTQDEPALEAMRKIDPASTRAAAVAMSARAWLPVDRRKAMDLLRRAIEADRAQPSFDNGQLDFAFDLLCADAIVSNQPAQAAQIRRTQATRVRQLNQFDARPESMLDLFALHALLGPLEGLADDLRS